MMYPIPSFNLRLWLADVWRGLVVMALVIAFTVASPAVVLAAKQG